MISEEELRDNLSRTAMVALAARSARRVLPLALRELPGEHARAVMDAIEVAESFAMTAEVSSLNAVASAARAVSYASYALAASHAAAASSAADSDFKRLKALGLGKPGTVGQPIDPSQNGPLGSLWPHGEPEWYRKAWDDVAAREEKEKQEASAQLSSESNAAPITLLFDASEFSDEDIATALTRFSDLYRSIGGERKATPWMVRRSSTGPRQSTRLWFPFGWRREP